MRQTDLAKAARMKQSAISRLEQAEYSRWGFNTLIRIADSLDARVIFRLEAAEDTIAEVERQERARASAAEHLAKLENRQQEFSVVRDQLQQAQTVRASKVNPARTALQDAQKPATGKEVLQGQSPSVVELS